MKQNKTPETPTLSSKMIKHNNPTGFFEFEDVKDFLRLVLEDIENFNYEETEGFNQYGYIRRGIKEIIRKRAGDLI